jgi:hypothetical protein
MIDPGELFAHSLPIGSSMPKGWYSEAVAARYADFLPKTTFERQRRTKYKIATRSNPRKALQPA